MEIKTKFNLRQKVYFMYKNKVNSLQIDSIIVRAITLGSSEEDIEISYKLCGLTDHLMKKSYLLQRKNY